MSFPRSWFNQGSIRKTIQPGQTITLSHPRPSTWKIETTLKEHHHQTDLHEAQQGAYSYVSILLSRSCIESESPHQNALIRLYMQVPCINTEFEDPATRASQAVQFKPRELRAYQILTKAKDKDKDGTQIAPQLLGYKEDRQDSSGLVPGGLLTWVAWEVLPGKQLGDLFWKWDGVLDAGQGGEG